MIRIYSMENRHAVFRRTRRNGLNICEVDLDVREAEPFTACRTHSLSDNRAWRCRAVTR
ncbi:hypothetical protein MPEAHAMD_3359 [Methylobacterium frigidaeris]|uniref:Uncharacterized protein n=1 Tax=Methylobacterium frigidaeris TaxID=2038277 RepID=A0AA37HDC4_9HYPH|nr:hypothetical protein MPEAHAMD_3359 [Methylobacterium frigidaeris]